MTVIKTGDIVGKIRSGKSFRQRTARGSDGGSQIEIDVVDGKSQSACWEKKEPTH